MAVSSVNFAPVRVRARPGPVLPGEKASGFRRDIQGLRAVAVAAVVGDHVFGWPHGGFVGVDVFFVISGFLITGLLLREVDRTGRVSFVAFYKRRVKRIAPLAVVVLAATVLASSLLVNAARSASIAVDAAWAALFAANVHLVAVETDYFQNQGPVSPLQHFWSLSVEEQFYFVWPAILGLVVLLTPRARPRLRVAALGCVLGLVVVASLAEAMAQTAVTPQGAYFSTVTRAWELGVGAGLAIASGTLARLPRALPPVLLWAGITGIVASCLLIDTSLPFPGPWAAAPVVATALVIAAGTGTPRAPSCPPLTSRLAQYGGAISYSVYLWHFPVQVFVRDDPALDAVRGPVTLVVALGLAIASHHLIEMPIIRSPWLVGDRTGAARRWRWSRWLHDESRGLRRAGLGSLAFVTVLLVAVALAPTERSAAPIALPAPAAGGGAGTAGAAGSADAAGTTSTTGSAGATPTPATATGTAAGQPAEPTTGPETAKLQADVRSALEATTWPALSPSIETILDGKTEGGRLLRCGSADELKLAQSECTWGPAAPPKTAVLVGDSTAMHYLASLVPLAEAPSSTWSLVNRAMFACPFTELAIRNDTAGIVPACRQHNRDTLAFLESTKPDLVIVTNSYQPLTDDATGRPVTAAAWSTGLASFLDRISQLGTKIVSVAPPPDDADIAVCYRPRSTPADCITRTSPTWQTRFAGDRGEIEKRGGALIDSRSWLCLTDLCPAFIGATPVKEDRVHLTSAFAARLSPAMGEALRDLDYFATTPP